jgi:hypothetical protein
VQQQLEFEGAQQRGVGAVVGDARHHARDEVKQLDVGVALGQRAVHELNDVACVPEGALVVAEQQRHGLGVELHELPQVAAPHLERGPRNRGRHQRHASTTGAKRAFRERAHTTMRARKQTHDGVGLAVGNHGRDDDPVKSGTGFHDVNRPLAAWP